MMLKLGLTCNQRLYLKYHTLTKNSEVHTRELAFLATKPATLFLLRVLKRSNRLVASITSTEYFSFPRK